MNDNHFAVVVGINWYPGIPQYPLIHAKTDAIEFHRWLTNPGEGGVPPNQAELIIATEEDENRYKTVEDDPHPIREQVNKALRRFHRRVDGIALDSWKETRLYLYVAGHGVTPSQGRGALLFADCEPLSYWGDFLDLSIYDRYYEGCPLFYEVVLLADCCRTISTGVPRSSHPFGECTHSRPTRRVIGYATTISREAKEPLAHEAGAEREARGFFTQALLRGLRGAATHDKRTGAIDRTRLERYVKDQVITLSGPYAQEPELRGDDIVFVHVNVANYDVEFLLPESWRDPLDVWDSDRAVVASWTHGDPNPWIIPLPNGLYKATSSAPEALIGDRLFAVEGGPIRVEI